MIKLLIADDHSIVRAGFKQIVDEIEDMTVAAEAADGDEVLQKVRNADPDVIVLDIAMPGANGLDVLKELRQECPEKPVLILSMYPEEQYALRMLRAGAAGYLTKQSAPTELVTAVRKVSQGMKYVTESLAQRLAVSLVQHDEKPPHEKLSDREFQVLCMIASGLQVKDIAEELQLSVKTVSTYRSRILEKMNLSNNSQLTYYSIRNNLIQ